MLKHFIWQKLIFYCINIEEEEEEGQYESKRGKDTQETSNHFLSKSGENDLKNRWKTIKNQLIDEQKIAENTKAIDIYQIWRRLHLIAKNLE